MELADDYVEFIRDNLDEIRERVCDDEFLANLFEEWYTANLNVLCDWMSDRMELQLHIYQLNTLLRITGKMYKDFELHGVPSKILNSKTYENVKHRLQVEEATASVTNQMVIHNGSMSQDDEDDDDN